MEVLYKIKASEMDNSFLISVRKLFKEKDLIIKISDDLDETDFLSIYESNEKHISENMVAKPSAVFKDDQFSKYIASYKNNHD
jgi:hypothetical protein